MGYRSSKNGCMATFCSVLETYVEECLKGKREEAAAKGDTRFHGASLKAVITSIEQGERQGIAKYSTFLPDKRNWGDLDHLAFLLYRCQVQNKNNRNGVFFNKDWPLHQKYHAIWQAMAYMTNHTNNARTQKEEANRQRQAKVEAQKQVATHT